MNRWVVVKQEFVGWHQWPEAPEQRAYLRDLHRHKFFVTLHVSVEHNDREVEFHDVSEALGEFLAAGFAGPIGRTSCEDIGQSVIEFAEGTWPGRRYRCEVWEDNEVGAIMERLDF